MRDLLVVGGGPAGLSAAIEAARLGLETEVLEEHDGVGIPEHCAGLVSLKGLHEILGAEAPIIREIKGFRVYSPSGKAYTLVGEGAKAAVIDRPSFDRELLRRAEARGATVTLGSQFRGQEGFRVLINAEGTAGRVSRKLGFEMPESIPAAQLDLETTDFDEGLVEIYLGSSAPGFFAWAVPRKGEVRVGLATRTGVPLRSLERLIERFEPWKRLSRAKRSAPIFGKVVTGGPIRVSNKGNAIAIGDAGGFVKPTTGGGVVLGCLTARFAARAAYRFLSGEAGLDSFGRAWKRSYGRDFMLMRLARSAFNRMGANEIDSMLESLYSSGALSGAIKYDMDLQGKALFRLVRSRNFIKLVPAALRAIF